MSKEFICTDLQKNKYSVSADELSFRPSAYGVIIQKNKILLSKQWDGYDFPGGGIHIGETIEEALLREVKEETGLNIKVGKILTCETSFFKLPKNGKYIHSLLLYYLCHVTSGELSTEFLSGDEKNYVDMPEWIDLAKISNIKFCNSADSLKIIKLCRC
jgi:8-oxo-dGTP diphosphatase